MTNNLTPPILDDVFLSIRRGNTLKISATVYNPDGTIFSMTGSHVKIDIRTGDDSASTPVLVLQDNDGVNNYITLAGAVADNFIINVPKAVTAALEKNSNLYMEAQFTNTSGETYTWWTGKAAVTGDIVA